MLDPLLRRFMDAANDTEERSELDMIIGQHALPLAKVIAARKLRSYRGSSAADQEDVAAETMVTLVARLRSARLDPQQAPIENFSNYAAAVTHSVCSHHIRRRYPERARLKDRLRYLFSSDPRLALWTTSKDELAAGRAEWRGREIDPAVEQRTRDWIARDGLNWAGMSRAELTAAIWKLLNTAGEPVEFEWLVSAAASAAEIIEPRGTRDPALLASPEPPQDVLAGQRRFLARAWEEVAKLPLKQRVALLLNLRDANGGGLLWLLPVLGVATIRQIARILEIPDREFAGLWREIPMDDAAIGERLQCSRQQVINLRMSARKRLVNHLGEISRQIGGRDWPGNLVRISASQKDRS